MQTLREIAGLFMRKHDGRWEVNRVAFVPVAMLLTWIIGQAMMLIILQVAMWPAKIW